MMYVVYVSSDSAIRKVFPLGGLLGPIEPYLE